MCWIRVKVIAGVVNVLRLRQRHTGSGRNLTSESKSYRELQKCWSFAERAL